MTDPKEDDPPPVAPRRPDNDECCGGGCNPCIFDAYEDARERYENALAAWRARHGLVDAARGADAPSGGKN
ncbi:MAG TPA: oxidoreductase-like domain-containing protein [Casimicrobiaceae bacterium]|nr:oxidoreductase-like domain-containing protein [Casimicrobiaceae bacterium]